MKGFRIRYLKMQFDIFIAGNKQFTGYFFFDMELIGYEKCLQIRLRNGYDPFCLIDGFKLATDMFR